METTLCPHCSVRVRATPDGLCPLCRKIIGAGATWREKTGQEANAPASKESAPSGSKANSAPAGVGKKAGILAVLLGGAVAKMLHHADDVGRMSGGALRGGAGRLATHADDVGRVAGGALREGAAHLAPHADDVERMAGGALRESALGKWGNYSGGGRIAGDGLSDVRPSLTRDMPQSGRVGRLDRTPEPYNVSGPSAEASTGLDESARLGDDAAERFGNAETVTGSQGNPRVGSPTTTSRDASRAITRELLRSADDLHADRVAKHTWPPEKGEHVSGRILRSLPPQAYDPPTVLNPRVIAIIPESDPALAKVFQRTITGESRREINRIRTQFAKLGHHCTLTSESDGERQLFEFIAHSDANPIVIVGHSEESELATRYLRLPNGDTVTIDAIHEAGVMHDKRCLILSCYSEDFRIPGRLRLDDALSMCQSALRSDGTQSVDELIDMMRRRRNAQRATRIGMSSVVSGSGVASVVIAYSCLDDDSDSQYDSDESPDDGPEKSASEQVEQSSD